MTTSDTEEGVLDALATTGKNSVIGAGSAITKSIPAIVVPVGHSATTGRATCRTGALVSTGL